MNQFRNTTTINLLRGAIIALLYAVLLTPLLLSTGFFFPYISTKVFYFRLLVEVIFGLYIILVAVTPSYRPRFTKLSVAVVIYLGIMFLASIFGVNFYKSFWSNTERGEGLLTLMHIIALFIVLIGIFRDWKSWQRFFIAMVMISFASAIYATFQKLCPPNSNFLQLPKAASFSLRFCKNYIVSGDVSRISALIGNAAYYAGYLLINFYLAAWLIFLKGVGKTWKVLLGVAAVYDLVILNYTKTRGGILALFFSLILLLLIFIFSSKKRRLKQFSFGLLVLIIVLSGLAYIFRDSPFIDKAGGLQNVTHISRDDVTTESRLLTWNAAWKGWKDRFFLGYGYENFNIAFNKYFPAKIFRDAGSQIWFDRAHNIFFDEATAGGIFALVSYLALFVLAFYALRKFYLKDKEKNLSTAAFLSALLFGYFIQNLFVFDSLSTYIAFYSILGFIVFAQVSDEQGASSASTFLSGYVAIIALLVIPAVLYASYYSVFKPARANLSVTKGLIYGSQGKINETLDSYAEAISLNTYTNEEARQKLAEAAVGFLSNQSISNEFKLKAFRYAIDEMKKAIEKAPKDPRNHLYLMALYNNIPNNERGPREEVVRYGRLALELSPRPQVYFEMGQAAYSLGRIDEARSYFQKGLELNPEPAESRWNLALIYALTGDFDQANKHLDYIYDHDRTSKISDSNMRNLIQIFGNLKQYQSTIRLYQNLILRHPEDSNLRQNLAEVYGQLCRVEEAEKELGQAQVYHPELANTYSELISKIRAPCQK